jgi:hypothetical protein
MTETEKFRTERLGARSWQIEDLPLAMELWGDPAVTALRLQSAAPETEHFHIAITRNSS